MKILLRLPNWLGDAIMATAAIEVLKEHFPQASFTIVGTPITCAIFDRDKSITTRFIDESKKSKNRLFGTYNLAKKIGKHDISITFTNNIFSALLLFWTKTPIRIGYAKNLRSFLLTDAPKIRKNTHQVLLYSLLLKNLFKQSEEEIIAQTPKLKLIAQDRHNDNNIRIGLSPGAAFGSAKRWLKEYFAETAFYFISKGYEVILFGDKNDIEPAKEITSIIKKFSADEDIFKNLSDFSGKTTINSLIDNIYNLDLFIANDSGPMHMASALGTPLIAIFGPTDERGSYPWKHPNSVILNKKIACAPCKKRDCPLKHHNCMKLITPDEVITQANHILSKRTSNAN
ncbi:lipopolysaccharide heptosyltransferase II [Helicobacter cappadocius]|uniref:lipopolysaccharide heptosyltransferase II n=1 Tax=Helicobacter cappadocius TaxID=3063998 RepID=A0AA90T5R7_9HELI|nr:MULTISPECIES: lipopolysaccharide heptosyltransferase II [unclassified Helicobacter]MDO7253920.1 lipopolysaccharide heptosyltransferase II [Helicobacter sp. faydin-H75]MDP2539783.1 lipopolysaccharide heptosyltransferase II [Helicobacter sp. faydin-H76]